MNAEERRTKIGLYLSSSDSAVTGSELSRLFGVSRQIIVQDITVLKAKGYDVISTHNGYIVQKAPYKERVFKLRHDRDETEKALYCIVSHGAIVVEDFVWHKVYGKIRAGLNIHDEQTVKKFMDGVRSGKSTELMDITGGYHYHTVRADNEETLDAIESELKRYGFLVDGD